MESFSLSFFLSFSGSLILWFICLSALLRRSRRLRRGGRVRHSTIVYDERSDWGGVFFSLFCSWQGEDKEWGGRGGGVDGSIIAKSELG